MLFKVGFVLANFSMTVLRISFSFFIQGLWFSVRHRWFFVLRAELSSAPQFLLCCWDWWLDSVIQTLLFHIAINSNSSFTTNCMIENGSTFICGFLSIILCILCVVQKSDEFLTSSALCAASLNQWRESSFSWFLLLLRRDSSSACILNKVQRKRGRNVWLISKCGQNCLLFILQLILEPFTRSSGMFCCLAPASRVQHRVRALSEGWYLSYGSGKWGDLTTGVCISP